MARLVERDAWVSAVGRLLVAFGGIENIARTCVRKLCPEVVSRHTAKLRLTERLKFASDLVEDLDCDPAQKAAFKAAVTTALALNEDRNLVAHNPLCLVFFVAEDGSYEMKQAIARDNMKHIDLLSLKKKAAEAEACEEAMSTAFYALVSGPQQA